MVVESIEYYTSTSLLYPSAFQLLKGYELDEAKHTQSMEALVEAQRVLPDEATWGHVKLEQTDFLEAGVLQGMPATPCLCLLHSSGMVEQSLQRLAQVLCEELTQGSVVVTTSAPISAYLPNAPPWTPGAMGYGASVDPKPFKTVHQNTVWFAGAWVPSVTQIKTSAGPLPATN